MVDIPKSVIMPKLFQYPGTYKLRDSEVSRKTKALKSLIRWLDLPESQRVEDLDISDRGSQQSGCTGFRAISRVWGSLRRPGAYRGWEVRVEEDLVW